MPSTSDPDAELTLMVEMSALLDSMAARIKKLETQVTKLEAQQKCLEVWQPGQGNAWHPLAERSEGRQEPGKDA
jgi:hypothetical protein